jgi:ABC-type multidrug transport system ATPase subunit/ABC-type transport system involved in multi-copper enzyme maturation permease subunit
MIEILGVSKQYGSRAALKEVSLTLESGEVTLLLGANGAGKSTLLRCILGLTSFDGRIRVAGLDPLGDGRSVRALIGYMPQSGGLHTDLTVAETMALFADIRRTPRERCARLLEEAGLAADGDRRVGDLSGGMRQRLGFALALLTDPQILVLDEPSASLDSVSRRWLADRLRDLAADGRCVLVSTHGQELFDAGDRRVVLEEGRIVQCTATPIADRRIASSGGHAALQPGARGAVAPIVRKELRDALRNRWLIGYASLLGILGVAATAAGLDNASGLSLQTFGRTTATMMNFCLLLAPLVAVLMGAAAIAGEQDRGTLEHLLAQPLSRTGLLAGKHAALLIALAGATVIGFAPAGVVVAAAAGPSGLGYYLLFPVIAILAAAAMAALGLFISTTSRSAAQAQGAAIFAWFGFVLLYDLVLVGTLATASMPPAWLAAAIVANPIDAARVIGVLALEPDLYLLGPAGAFLVARIGSAGTAALLVSAVTVWAIAPFGAAAIQFSFPLWRKRTDDSNRILAAWRGQRSGVDDRVRVERRIA